MWESWIPHFENEWKWKIWKVEWREIFKLCKTIEYSRWKNGNMVVKYEEEIWKKKEMEKKKWRELKENKPFNTSDGREVRELKPKLMEEGERWRERLKMRWWKKRGRKKRENGGCQAHWKFQIQLKQDWSEIFKKVEKEWRKKWMGERMRRRRKSELRFEEPKKAFFLKTQRPLF